MLGHWIISARYCTDFLKYIVSPKSYFYVFERNIIFCIW